MPQSRQRLGLIETEQTSIRSEKRRQLKYMHIYYNKKRADLLSALDRFLLRREIYASAGAASSAGASAAAASSSALAAASAAFFSATFLASSSF